MSDTLIETGLLAPTVNQPPAPVAPTPVTAAVTPPELPAGWDLQKAFALMRELAQQMFDVPIILKNHNVTAEQFEAMKANDQFARTLDIMTAEWFSADNTPKRLALEALVALENKLPDVVARLGKPTEPLSSVVMLAEFLGKIGGLGQPKTNAAAPTEKFKITINLGADTQEFEKRTPVIVVDHDAQTTGDMALQQLSQGPRVPQALRFLPPGESSGPA